jgi:type I restriction enzyme, R subunit
MVNEAKSRIKINKILENTGWRFFDNKNGKANIKVESRTIIKKIEFDEFGDNFEKVSKGYLDYELLDNSGKPILVLEAKNSKKNPLSGKEQARTYAKNKNVRFVILSNGENHYFWDIEKGNPYSIEEFYSLEEIEKLYGRKNKEKDNFLELKNFEVKDDLIYSKKLRYYQKNAINKIKNKILNGCEKFLIVMATGTGKTLVSAGICKMLIKTEVCKKILFLVDRLELEEQASQDFYNYFREKISENFEFGVYKENKQDYGRYEILITTIQSFFDNYKKFSKTEFDLIISDEAHRSLGGVTSRKVFDYFNCYKLGLTATPKTTTKNLKIEYEKDDFRELEIRKMKDTYLTFGCSNFEPTFSYTLEEGTKDGFLVLPKVVEITTEITTELLSKKGYEVKIECEDERNKKEVKSYKMRDFERRFISDNTNKTFCENFFNYAKKDPITEEIGKSIFYCVSQNHAHKITNMLNEIAMKKFPEKYNSDFAMTITSNVEEDLAKFRKQFRNNKLSGTSYFREDLKEYKTSKTRVCVTYGMMTTGYDCSDLLNIVMLRPIYSPSDFIQIKGRGTRKFLFEYKIRKFEKEDFYLFDFFENCEFFEKYYNYKKPINVNISVNRVCEKSLPYLNRYVSLSPDKVFEIFEKKYIEVMKVDKEFYKSENNEKKIYTFDDFYNILEGDILERLEDSFYDKFHKKATREEIFEWVVNKKEPKSKDEIIESLFCEFEKEIENIDIDIIVMKKFFFGYFKDKKLRGIIKRKDYNKIEDFSLGINMFDFSKIIYKIPLVEKFYKEVSC